jgi:Fur family ferric uptake transcriptional regulator
MSITLAELKQKLLQNHSKLTPQRQMILEAFLNHQEQHLSAEDVHLIVKPLAPDIGVATVYRTLELLSDLKLLQKMDFGDGRSRYEIHKEDEPHRHHHLICLSCGKVREFDDDLLETLELAIAQKSNFTIVDHELKFYGYCQDCRKPC